MTVLWRIAGAHHPAWSKGARLHGGRWNPPGLPVVYAGTSYRADPADIASWNVPDQTVAQACGKAWLQACAAPVLLIPSVVTAGLDWNAMINPAHPDFTKITVNADPTPRPRPPTWNQRKTQRSFASFLQKRRSFLSYILFIPPSTQLAIA